MTKSNDFATSRIPLPLHRVKGDSAKERQEHLINGFAKQSRLEEMQAQYRSSVMKEKENNLLRKHAAKQTDLLQRINTRGKVREFFSQSRGQDLNDPMLHRRFRELHNDTGSVSSANKPYSEVHESRYLPSQHSNGSMSLSSTRSTPRLNGTLKNSHGRDKSSPLQPLSNSGQFDSLKNGYTHIPPIQQSDQTVSIKKKVVKKTLSFKEESGANSTSKSQSDNETVSQVAIPKSASTGKLSEFQKWKLQTQSGNYLVGSRDFKSDDNESPRSGSDTEFDLFSSSSHDIPRKVNAEEYKRQREQEHRQEEMDRKKAAADEKKKKQEELAQKKREIERQKAEETTPNSA